MTEELISSDETDYPVTKHWIREFEASEVLHPDDTVLHLMPCVEQTFSYSCGPCTVATIVNKLKGIDLSEADALSVTKQILTEMHTTTEESGTPIEAMIKLFEHYGVEANPITYENHTDPKITARAQRDLENYLKTGYVCLVAMQETPDFLMEEVTTGNKIMKSAIYNEEPKEKYQHVRDENNAPIATKGDPYWNGHYTIIVGEMTVTHIDKKGNKYIAEYYIRLDTASKYIHRDDSYKPTGSERPDQIDPRYYGLTLMAKPTFLRNWYDTSSDGKIPYDHLMMPFKVE